MAVRAGSSGRAARPLREVGAGDVATVGGKAANLGELVRAGLPVPDGVVLTTAAYDGFVAGAGLADRIAAVAGRGDDPAAFDSATFDSAAFDSAAFDSAAAEIRGLFRAAPVPPAVAVEVRDVCAELGGGALAVRSSATAEDLADASFAGQQDSFLDVHGPDAVLAAVVECWASLWTARALAYRHRRGIAPEDVSLAVVVQRMVEAESAGVLFTADPATGRRDRVAISAAWGLGESVVGAAVGTEDLVVDRVTGAVVSRRTAEQAEMTVPTGSGTAQRPVPAGRGPVLDDAAAAELAALGARIEDHFGAPQDVEWARVGGVFHVVQSRPVTALPEPSDDPPTTWPLPFPGGLYFRASIVEQLPDPLTPLFADLIDGSVSRSLAALMAQAFGTDVLREGDIGLPTINGYAYYHYRSAAFRRMLLRSPAAVRALFGSSGRRAGIGGVAGWRDRSHPRYVAVVAVRSGRDPADVGSAELLHDVGVLLDAGTEYYTAVQSIIPLAATAEIAFRAFYDRLLRRAGDPAGHTFLLGFDSEPIRAEKSLHDLATAARDAGLAPALDGADRAALLTVVRDGGVPVGADPTAWAGWAERFRAHLDRFGHTVYNLDFADPVPADAPGPLLDTVRFHLSGAGVDPYERQRDTARRRDEQTAAVRARLGPVRRTLFDRLLRSAQELGPVREDALSDMGLAWPAMRRMLAELGRRLVASGVLAEPDEVFWLRAAELRAALAGAPGPDLAPVIAARRRQWRGRRRATPPQMLPQTGWAHAVFGPFLPAGDQNQTGAVLTGVGASSGTVTGRARVLDGPADFAAMRPGDVLVARITTPAWTSLFAMASAVVTDVGGPLSHSSIVAREYGVPAVLGTGSGTGRIRTGQLVRVDGDTGTVTLLDG